MTVMENVVEHKSSRYSWRINFNKCPEILFSELEKELVRAEVKNYKAAKANKQNNSKTARKPKATRATNKSYNSHKSYKSQEAAKTVAAYFISHKHQKPLKPRNQKPQKPSQEARLKNKNKKRKIIPPKNATPYLFVIKQSFHRYGLVLPALIYDLFLCLQST